MHITLEVLQKRKEYLIDRINMNDRVALQYENADSNHEYFKAEAYRQESEFLTIWLGDIQKQIEEKLRCDS